MQCSTIQAVLLFIAGFPSITFTTQTETLTALTEAGMQAEHTAALDALRYTQLHTNRTNDIVLIRRLFNVLITEK